MPISNNRPPTNFAKLFTAFATLFKGLPDEKMADLQDALDDVPAFADQFNSPDRGNRARVTTGPSQAASGGGAERMVSDYSELATQGGLTAAYAQFARELADMGARVEKSERAISSIAGLVAQAAGKSFPTSEVEPDDKGSELDEDKDEEENVASSKSADVLNIGGVPDLMRLLSGVSRSTGRAGLVQPPNLAVVKAGYKSEGDRLSDASEQAYSRGDAKTGMELATLSMRHKMASAGAAVDQRYLHNITVDANALIAQSGAASLR